MNNILAGMIAALPVSALGVVYMLVSGHAFVQMVKGDNPDTAALSDQGWFYLLLASMALAPFAFGVVAGLVHGLIGNSLAYLGLVFSLAVVLSVLAWASRTPMPLQKTVMNFLVALAFGLLLPILAG